MKAAHREGARWATFSARRLRLGYWAVATGTGWSFFSSSRPLRSARTSSADRARTFCPALVRRPGRLAKCPAISCAARAGILPESSTSRMNPTCLRASGFCLEAPKVAMSSLVESTTWNGLFVSGFVISPPIPKNSAEPPQ